MAGVESAYIDFETADGWQHWQSGSAEWWVGPDEVRGEVVAGTSETAGGKAPLEGCPHAGHAAGGPFDLVNAVVTPGSEETEAWIMPERRGGRFNVEAGRTQRFQDQAKVIALARSWGMGAHLVLTTHREWAGGPEEAYQAMVSKACRLVTDRLGCRVWCRMVEFHVMGGWAHLHILMRVDGTEWDCALDDPRHPFRWAACLERVQDVWADKWHMSGRQGVNLTFWTDTRDGEREARYVAGYVTKGVEESPAWVDLRERTRMVNFSVPAGVWLVSEGLRRARTYRKPEPGRIVKRRPLGTLAERLIEDGLRCRAVDVKGRLGFGTIHGRIQDLRCVIGKVEGLTFGQRRIEKVSLDGEVWGAVRDVFVLKNPSVLKVNNINALLEEDGVPSRLKEIRESRWEWTREKWQQQEQAAERYRMEAEALQETAMEDGLRQDQDGQACT